MAKGDININSFRDLNEVLKNSFSGIKRDMDEIKQTQLLNIGTLKEMRDEMEGLKKDFVTVDKLNAIKIKMGDIKEDIKRFEGLEKEIKKVNEISVDKTAYAKESQKLEQSMTDIKNQLGFLDKMSKEAVTDNTFKRLTKEISDEFNAIRKDILNIEKEGGSIVRTELQKFMKKTEGDVSKTNQKVEGASQEIKTGFERIANALNDKINKIDVDINKKLGQLHTSMKSSVTEQQVKNLVKDINKEFDSVKEGFDEMKDIKNELKIFRKKAVSKDYMERYVDKRLRGVPVSELDGELEKETKRIKKEILKASKKAVPREDRPKRKPKFNAFTFSTALIIISFLALAASITLFFIDKVDLMDYFLVAAVALFMVGIGTRLYLVIREG